MYHTHKAAVLLFVSFKVKMVNLGLFKNMKTGV